MDNEIETQLTDIRKTVEKWRERSIYLKENEKPGSHIQDFACGEVMAYNKVLDLIDGKVEVDEQ